MLFSILGCGIYNFDFWWHLKTGEIIWESHVPPTTDPFSFTAPQAPWYNFHILFQVLTYLSYESGGLAGAYGLKVLLGLILFFLTAFRGGGLNFWGHLWFTLGLLAISFRFFLRPELLSMIYLVLYLRLLNHTFQYRIAIAIGLIQLLWANSHSIFFLGPFMVFLKFVSVMLEYKSFPETLKSKHHLHWVGLTIITLGLCSFTPHGLQGLLFPLNLIGKVTYAGDVFKQHITEFGPPDLWGKHYFFGIYCLLSLYAIVRQFQTRQYYFCLANLFTLVLALRAERNILLHVVTNLCTMSAGRNFPRTDVPCLPLLRLALGIMQCLFAFLLMTNQWYLQQGMIARFGPNINCVAFPRALPDLLKPLPENTPIWHTMSLGGYLIHQAPHLKVFYDGRLDVYGPQFFSDYYTSTYDTEVFESVLAHYQIELVVINHLLREADKPMVYLWRHAQWQPFFLDEHIAIFVRVNSAAARALHLGEQPEYTLKLPTSLPSTDSFFEFSGQRLRRLLEPEINP